MPVPEASCPRTAPAGLATVWTSAMNAVGLASRAAMVKPEPVSAAQSNAGQLHPGTELMLVLTAVGQDSCRERTLQTAI